MRGWRDTWREKRIFRDEIDVQYSFFGVLSGCTERVGGDVGTAGATLETPAVQSGTVQPEAHRKTQNDGEGVLLRCTALYCNSM